MVNKIGLAHIVFMCFNSAIFCQSSTLFVEEIKQAKELARVFPDSSYKNSLKILVEAKKSKSDFILAEAFNVLGFATMRTAKPDLSNKLLDTAIQLSKKINNKKILSEAYGTMGSNFQNKGDYVDAVLYHNKALEIAKSINHKSEISSALRSLAKINAIQGKFDKELEYLNKLKQEISEYENKRDEGLLYHSFGEHYANAANSAFAKENYKNAVDIFKAENDKYSEAWTESLWAIQYVGNDLNKTLGMMLHAQIIFDSLAPNSVFSATNIGNIGEVYRMFATNDSLLKTYNLKGIKKDKNSLLKASESFLLKQVNVAKYNKSDFDLMNATGNLANLYSSMNNFKSAFEYYNSYHGLSEKIFSQKNKNKLAKLEAEKDVIKLEAKNKLKTLQNYLLLVLLGSLVIFAALLHKNASNKQKIQKKQISELEKEKQLMSATALLKGQEEERSRLAKDLHDGLGGMLNGVKLQFNNMRENLVMTPENVDIFQRSLLQLDVIIEELRKVSHNLMPDVLVRFGLNDALKDFCKSQSTNTSKVVYQKMGDSRILDNTANLYIYRIVQELVTNALKHGQATQLLAQLSYNTNRVLITVDDNGTGYNVADLINNKGLGMRSIKQRVDYLKGKMDIDSKPGNGTSVNIELKI